MADPVQSAKWEQGSRVPQPAPCYSQEFPQNLWKKSFITVAI
jgi:hypothetical protein